MRKLLTTTVITAGLVATSVLGSAPAMAATTDANLAYFNTNLDASSLVALVTATTPCAITFANGVSRPKPGIPAVVSTFPVLTVDFTPTTKYVATVEGVTFAFITCTLY